jgi:PKHD-type hydroxylase
MKNKKVKDHIPLNTAWPFELDKLESCAFWNEAFSVDECKKIIDIGNKKGLLKGVIKGGEDKKIRDSQISWLQPHDGLHWAYRRLTDIILDLNSKFFKFDIYGFIEGLQFTSYKFPSGKYDKHVDRGLNMNVRKLSLSVQLSDPKSYQGGELLLHDAANPITISKEQGKLILFPSYVLHEVKPVTKGERYSLVAWITGPQFR